MRQFRYQALNAENQSVAGEIPADSVAHAISQLEAAGLLVQSIGYASGHVHGQTTPPIQLSSPSMGALSAVEQAALHVRLEKIIERARALTPAIQAFAAEIPALSS